MIKIYYRWCDLDKKHEYGIELPLYKSGSFPPYWNYWVWYYLGNLTQGVHSNPTLLPFANTWDEKCKLIKTYVDTRNAQKCATRIFNLIQKHYSKNNKLKELTV